MRKKLLIFLLVVLFACSFLTGCNKTYTVTVKSTPIQVTESSSTLLKTVAYTYNKTFTINVKENGVVGDIEIPCPEGSKFCGWFTDESYTFQWNTATDLVKGDMTLYAKWE